MKQTKPIYILRLPRLGVDLEIVPLSQQAKQKLKEQAKTKNRSCHEHLIDEVLLDLMLGRPEEVEV